MTLEAQVAASWWTALPPRRVSYLVGASAELLAIGLDPLPDSAPAVVQFRPATGAPLGDQVGILVDEMERAAVALFPRWLPGAERLDGDGRLSIAAVRALALATAAQSSHFGPFLAEQAERGLHAAHSNPVRAPSRFPAAVRAAGLARVVADAYGRHTMALLTDVPEGLSASDERALVASSEWLVQHSHMSVWLAGAPLRAVDRVRSVRVTLPAYLTELADLVEPDHARGGSATGHSFAIPPISGVPRADSPAETMLERALAPHAWANGRRWNHTYEWHVLGQRYRLDLYWEAERLVVEVDGPEHRGPLRFADDRRRDNRLQQLGHRVLRFPNDDVISDVQAVVSDIKDMLSRLRRTARQIRSEAQ
jgi:very-short-patch-repair endonuclease